MNFRSVCIGVLLLALPGPLLAAPILVDTGWVAGHMNDKNVVLVDMSGDDTQYDRFHLPGAIYLPYYALLAKPRKGEKFQRPIDDDTLVYLMSRLGISRASHVVIYDDMGGLNAGRLFWHLEKIGHNHVSVMNGGLVQWILEGRKVVNTPMAKIKPVNYGPRGSARDNEAVLSDVRRASDKGDALLLDVRTLDEYLGDMKKKQGGHVPGAHWWSWDQAVNFKGGFVRQLPDVIDGSLATKFGLKDKKKPVIAYCRSGHRAAQTYLTLRSLGYENVRLYAGSMNDYMQARAPLKLGKQP